MYRIYFLVIVCFWAENMGIITWLLKMKCKRKKKERKKQEVYYPFRNLFVAEFPETKNISEKFN